MAGSMNPLFTTRFLLAALIHAARAEQDVLCRLFRPFSTRRAHRSRGEGPDARSSAASQGGPVTAPFRIELTGARFADAVHVSAASQLRAALEALGLHAPRPTVVVVGGAAGLEEARMDGLRPLFAEAIAPAMHRHGAVGVDGGTRFGVMRLFGEARATSDVPFPLVGVVAAGPVKLPRGGPCHGVQATLEPNHTHFVVAPGQEWGAEAPWIARTATVLSGAAPSVTVLVSGGQIAYSDVRHSIDAGRRIIAISGSGGTADVLADALAGSPGDDRAAALVGSGLIRAVRMDEPAALAEVLTAVLGPSAGT
ncbi:hypothetical protein [Mycobacterium sp. E3198]|uniref:hypothetical protein n=1 Tax=Mycobacterium sp. E3198 TaxID=1834143 RepID=UPI0018D40BDA|nr:hypothetical protein [Mycobacterium sp. E3198]